MSDLETLRKILPAFVQAHEEVLREKAYLEDQLDRVDELRCELERTRTELTTAKGQLSELMMDKEIGEVLCD